MSNNLLSQKRFLPYFLTQFLGAFNDNVYKNALLIIITFHLVSSYSPLLVNMAAGIFILPFFLFSSIAGQWADKFEKAGMIRCIKLAEIAIMVFACIALYMQSLFLLMAMLFLLGAQSAFFGPIKYSILPQHLPKQDLLNANALVESGTFIAILLGTILGGLLASNMANMPWLMVCLLLIAIAGWQASRFVPSAAAVQPELVVDYNIVRASWRIIQTARQNRPVFLSIIAVSWFWFFGALILTQFPAFTKSVLSGDAQVATLLLAMFSIGIAVGAWLCAKLSGAHIEIGLMPIGAIGMTLFTWDLSGIALPATQELRTIMVLLEVDGVWRILLDLFLIAVSAGLFTVPLYAFIQVRSDEALRARMFAVTNIINSLFMVVASVLAVVCLSVGMSIPDLFKVTAILNLFVTLYIITVIPEFVLRLVGWILIHSIYRIGKEDLHHIPDSGAAVLVCNHVSFADPVIINAISNRPIRFVMIDTIYNLPVANWFFKVLKAIPIASAKKKPKLVEQAFDEIENALANGELVCIFPEGSITRDGELASFRPGIERIIQRSPVPVVPLALRGLWGTWFSRQRGHAMTGWPTQLMKKISVISGAPIDPKDVNKDSLYKQVEELRGNER